MNKKAIPAINLRIREVRSAVCLSQVKFSSILALSDSYIAGIETGRIPVNERLIKLVGTSFNVNETWLRYGKGDMFLEAIPEDGRFRSLVSMVRGLPPKYQDFLFGVLDMLLKLKE
jgi:transcriptional regulator with XRE-family HTH domain